MQPHFDHIIGFWIESNFTDTTVSFLLRCEVVFENDIDVQKNRDGTIYLIDSVEHHFAITIRSQTRQEVDNLRQSVLPIPDHMQPALLLHEILGVLLSLPKFCNKPRS